MRPFLRRSFWPITLFGVIATASAAPAPLPPISTLSSTLSGVYQREVTYARDNRLDSFAYAMYLGPLATDGKSCPITIYASQIDPGVNADNGFTASFTGTLHVGSSPSNGTVALDGTSMRITNGSSTTSSFTHKLQWMRCGNQLILIYPDGKRNTYELIGRTSRTASPRTDLSPPSAGPNIDSTAGADDRAVVLVSSVDGSDDDPFTCPVDTATDPSESDIDSETIDAILCLDAQLTEACGGDVSHCAGTP